MYGLRYAVYLLLIVATTANAHEFWIEPSRFEVAASDRIVADLRVGQYFKGNSQVLFPHQFVSFDVIDSAGTRPITGRLGDLPAVDIPAERSGLHVLVYRSTYSSVTYPDFEHFETFVRKQGLDWVVDAHRKRGLPEAGIKEAYTRYAKTLVKVGDGAGEDRAVGMPLELVAETNPYTDGTEDVAVRLLLQDEGYADAQISIFQKLEGCEATRSTIRTDADGRARIPAGPGGRILLNAVHMLEPRTQTLESHPDAAWESLWASLTYELPEMIPEGETRDCELTDTSHEEIR